MRTAVAALVLVACLAGAACSDDDNEDAAGRTSTTAASTTVGSSTTVRQAVEHSVVVGEHGVLGAWTDGHWVDAGVNEPDPLEAGQEFTVVPFEGPLSTATAVGPGESLEFCGHHQAVLRPELPERARLRDALPIAVSGVPEPRPRQGTLLDPDAAVYQQAAEDALADLGVEDPRGEVVQVVRVDLEGDGQDEVLVVAEQIAHPDELFGEPGDYSVVFLRRLEGERVRTSTVAEHRVKENEGGYILSHRIDSLADLNGDGRLEVVLHTHYYEGSGTHVFELGPNDALLEVLGNGCGV